MISRKIYIKILPRKSCSFPLAIYMGNVERINILLTLPFRGDARILLVKITRRIFYERTMYSSE